MVRALALVAALSVVSAAPVDPDATPPSPASSSDTCLTMNPDATGYSLTNACRACRIGLVRWCDGDARQIRVQAGSSLHIQACPGFQALVSDVPCETGHQPRL